MKTAGDLLSQARKGKKISLAKVARHLRLKESILEAIEAGDWPKLPELPFVKGFIKSYAQYLKLDPDYILALLRREYDEAKYPKRTSPLIGPRRLMFTPEKVAKAAFILIILAFVSYLVINYLSILDAPKLEVVSPSDDLTTTVAAVVIVGQTAKEATVAINGQFVLVDPEGRFSYQLTLNEGRNVIEITDSKRLSPKTKVVKVVRLNR